MSHLRPVSNPRTCRASRILNLALTFMAMQAEISKNCGLVPSRGRREILELPPAEIVGLFDLVL
jgi:hypothetical protein